ncbi:hypothetical protein [Actinomadura kijaniata]|uniref:hypothetical protein n=1 Tax=Actinomadura kijaniata TaxID=46161 RepID=UPI000837222C|nr:hypothetical protein [Actinomadura kijaniata]
MSGSVTITVPEGTTATFVVAADRRPSGIPSLPGPFTAEAARRVGSTRLGITTHPAALSPWDLQPGARTGWLADRAHAARWHVGVTAVLPATDRPFGLRVARAVARAIALAVHGVPVDADTGQVLPGPVEHPSFVPADDWLGVWLPPEREDTSDGACATAEGTAEGCACVTLTTRGMGRFGLPELRLAGAACAHGLAALNLLRTTAQRLLPLCNRPGLHRLPEQLELTGNDLAAHWGVRDPAWDGDPVPIRLTPLDQRLLRVDPPTRFPGSLNEWLGKGLPPALHELVACSPERVAA